MYRRAIWYKAAMFWTNLHFRDVGNHLLIYIASYPKNVAALLDVQTCSNYLLP